MLYPAHVPGAFYKTRSLVGFALIVLYLALPWIPVGGAPAVFFNIAERRMHLFGLTFLTQDLWLAFFVVSGLGFGLFTVTAVLGRVWCGWACPLTVFLDVVRKVERWIEGDGPKRKRLESEPASFGTSARRLLKQGAVGLLAAGVAHGFLAYFVSIPGLFKMMHEAPAAHPGAFLLAAGVTAVLWFSFAWFREQFCIVLCPYGRLQSVLTDVHTLVVGYDSVRGEPRGSRRGKAVAASGTVEVSGDCLDCGRCVQVCPTGIDIRQGLQLECIGCAACIDACDAVMEKAKRPRGLIRYDSLSGLAGKERRFWRPRLMVYGFLLAVGISAATLAVSTLREAVVSFTRLPGPPYFVENGVLRNQFLLRVLNKEPHANHFKLALEGGVPEGMVLQGDLEEDVSGWGETQRVIVLTLPLTPTAREGGLALVVRDAAGRVIARKPFTLLGPEVAPKSVRAVTGAGSGRGGA
jgi:cytochrome c oxidase accessory protein FixG